PLRRAEQRRRAEAAKAHVALKGVALGRRRDETAHPALEEIRQPWRRQRLEPAIGHGLHVRRHLRHWRADPGKRRRANHVDRRSLQLRSRVLRESPCRQARSGKRARYESPALRWAAWCY